MISFVIVTWNCRKHIENCLNSLPTIGLPDYETIVVDADSHDGTKEYLAEIEGTLLAREISLRTLIRDRKSHWSENNRLGFEMAHGNVLCFSNPDIIFNSDFKRVCDLAERSQNDFVSCVLVTPRRVQLPMVGNSITMKDMFFAYTVFGSFLNRHLARGRFSLSKPEIYANKHGVVKAPFHTASMFLVPRSVIDRFPEHWIYGKNYTWFASDNDMFERMRTIGISFLVDLDVRIRHEEGYSVKIAGWRNYAFERGYGIAEYNRVWNHGTKICQLLFFIDGVFYPIYSLLRRPLRHTVAYSAFQLKGALYPSQVFELA